MAEYKGLTIRIGGDTSQLNTALKGSTKAASSLQAQIRQITRAMRFDPSSLANVDTRMKLTTNRAEALYSKLRLLRSGYAELGRSTVEVGGSATSVKKLAESTENVALAATTAKERYNDMTATLAANYRELEARAKAAGQAMDLNALSRQGTDETFETQMAALKELGVVTDEEVQKLREMRSTWNEAFDTSEAYKAADTLRSMETNMQRLESEARSSVSTVRELNTVSRMSADSWQESAERVKALDSALAEASKRAQTYETALRQDPSNLDAAVGRLRALSDQYDLAQQKANELSARVSAYEENLAGTLAKHRNLTQYIQETGDAWQKVQQELAQAKGEASALHQSLQRLSDAQAPVEEIRQLESEVREADARVDALNRSAAEMDARFETAKECSELQQLQTELAQTESKMSTLQSSMSMRSIAGGSMLDPSTIKSLGMTLYSTLTPALTMVGWRMVSAAEDIDSAYRDMRKTVDGTEEQFEHLKQTAIEFSETHVTSADQLMSIMAIGGELGIATDNLEAFAETVSNLDVATNLETEEAAESLGKLANITKMGADEYDNYADALVRLGNNGASTEDQIVGVATRIGAMGTIVGMSVPEILALSSTIAATGMNTEAAGTAISNTFSDIESAVANGGEKLDAFAKVAGMSAEEFATAWETHPIEAFKAFVEGLNEVEENGGSAVTTLEEMGITGERQKQAILGLMQTIGGLNDNLTMSNDAWNGQTDQWGQAGDAAREAEKKAEGFSGQLQILKNIANDALAELAEGATPLIKDFTDLAKSALDAFKAMSDGSKTAVVKLLGFGAVVGPLLTVVATIATGASSMTKFVKGADAISKAAKLMGAGADEAGLAVRGLIGLGSKGGLVGLAAAAAIAAGALGYKAYQDYKKSVDDARLATEGFLTAETEGFADAQTAVGDNVSSARDRIDELRETLTETADMVRGWQDQWAELGIKRGQLDYYIGVMEELGGRTDLTKGQQQELNDAVEKYNEITGDTVTLDENFNLSKTRDELKQTAKEWYNVAAAQQYVHQAEELLEKKAELEEQAAHKSADVQRQKDYIENLESQQGTTAATYDQDLAEDIQNAKSDLQDLEAEYAKYDKALQGVNDSLDEMYARSQVLDQTMLSSVLGNGELAGKLENAEVNASEFADWLTIIGANADSMGSITGENADMLVKSFKDLSTVADGLGVDVNELAQGMEDWGITTADVTAVGVENFAKFYQEAGGDMEQVKKKIDEYKAADIENKAELDTEEAMYDLSLLDEAEVPDKEFGAFMDSAQANSELASIQAFTIGDKTFWVSSDGTVYDETQLAFNLDRQVASIDGKNYVVSDGGTTSSCIRKTQTLHGTLDDTSGSYYANVYAETYGASKVSTLLSNLRAAAGNWWASLTVNASVNSATGSVADSPYIPRHASGYVAFGPTMTNNGWVGEDGAEAILNWGTGGAVIPLTNHRYMDPIAHEIARSLAPLLETGGAGSTNVYLNDVRVNDSPAIREATKDYLLELNRLAVI